VSSCLPSITTRRRLVR